jgi:hypothetical protein
MEGENSADIKVVPHLDGPWKLLTREYEVDIRPAEPPDLGPFNPPDSYTVERELEKDPAEPVQVPVLSSRLDLGEFAQTIDDAQSRGQGIEFHVYEGK